jgi:hypothetical protein
LDLLDELSLASTSALISKLPISEKLTPSRIILSKSPILDLFISIFFLILLIALLAATSEKITEFLAFMISYFLFKSA